MRTLSKQGDSLSQGLKSTFSVGTNWQMNFSFLSLQVHVDGKYNVVTKKCQPNFSFPVMLLQGSHLVTTSLKLTNGKRHSVYY